MSTAIRIENLSKRYRLGETHETTLSAQITRTAGRLFGFARPVSLRPPEDFWALRDINLELMAGETLGIIGGNGAGKSTLLKILSRVTHPTTGRALVRGRLASLLEVGTGFHPELTGRENVFLNGTILGMRKAEVARKFDEIVAFAGVEKFIDTPVKRYSSGMYVRLAFAVAAHLEPDVLIVDEVLAVGDAGFQKRCLGKMGDVARQGRTVLFVSHNMAAIRALCMNALWLNAGRVMKVGKTEAVIEDFIDSSGQADEPAGLAETGFLYRESYDEPACGSTRVLSVQLLDKLGNKLRTAQTDKPMRARVEFYSEQDFRSFAVEIRLSTMEGVPIVWIASSPSSGVDFSVEQGRYFVECELEKLPLSAGRFKLGVALAVPGAEYLWKNDSICSVDVTENDVFGTGYPPLSSRYLVHVPHIWYEPKQMDK